MQAKSLIERSVREWALAWSGKYVDEYLDVYTPNFVPKGLTHDAWKKQRMERISKPKVIEITLRNLHVAVLDDTHATVTFIQAYRSDNYRDQVEKTLHMVKQSERWLIADELVGKASK
jgi:uncharacterized protein YchJ